MNSISKVKGFLVYHKPHFSTISTFEAAEMADTRPIPAFDNEQLEQLTQIRLARIWRNNARREIIREARIIRRRAIDIQTKYTINGQPPRALVLWGLRQRLEELVRTMLALRAREEASRETEAVIWRNVDQL